MADRELIDIREAERLTGLKRNTLYKMAHAGRLRSFRVLGRSVRFDLDDVLALVRAEEGDTAAMAAGDEIRQRHFEEEMTRLQERSARTKDPAERQRLVKASAIRLLAHLESTSSRIATRQRSTPSR